MALYYPQVKALAQGTRGLQLSSDGWDIFPSTAYDSTASSPYGSHAGLSLFNHYQPIEYYSDGIRLGGVSGTGHCGFVTQGSTYTVDLTKDFRLYYVMKNWGSSDDYDNIRLAFISGSLGSSVSSSVPPAPIPKHSENFGVTVGGWFMRNRSNLHRIYRRTSTSSTSFSAYGSTNTVGTSSYSDQRSATYDHYWNIHEFRYDHSLATFEYHQHRQGLNSDVDLAGTNSQGSPISDYYTTSSRFYDFTFGTQGSWMTPSSMDLTSCHIAFTYYSSGNTNRFIFPRIGLIQTG